MTHVYSPKFTCCVTSRYDTHGVSCRARRACRAVPVPTYFGRRRSSSSARMYCALDMPQFAGTTSGKSEVDMSTPVHAVATLLNTCRASRVCRACRDERVMLCCPTSATQHVTTFSCTKMQGLDGVSCRDVTSQVEFGLIRARTDYISIIIELNQRIWRICRWHCESPAVFFRAAHIGLLLCKGRA